MTVPMQLSREQVEEFRDLQERARTRGFRVELSEDNTCIIYYSIETGKKLMSEPVENAL